ncbi:MAG: peptidase S8 [Myxococcales bacterium]|nr:peptidase S8 [Myxococcales bacterium]
MNDARCALRRRHRTTFASLGLVALAALVAYAHRADDRGMSAEAIDTPTLAAAAAVAGDAMTGALILDLVEPEDGEGGSEAELAALIEGLGLPVEAAGFYSEGEHLFRVSGSAADLAQVEAALADHPLVEGIEPEVLYALIDAGDGEPAPEAHPRFEPNDAMFNLQWHMEMIRAPEAWSVTRGDGVVVAVIDTGVAWKDTDQTRMVPDLAGTRFTHGKSFVNGLADGLDDHLHGTHVAGTIAQTTNNEIGVTGVAFESTIMPLKVLGGDGRGSVTGIANAIRYAADNGAQVINMSLGGPLPSRVLGKAIEYANEKGVTVVCAAGNEAKSRVGYPAANKGSVAVASVDAMGERTWYSNWGDALDVSAPGGDTRADKNGDGFPDGVLQDTIKLQDPLNHDYMWLQGTSMASPHAAGVAALIVARGVTNPAEVERIMKASAVHPNKVEWDREYGAGVIDAVAAVDAVAESYDGERAGFAGLLALLGIGGIGGAGIAAAGATSLALDGDERRRRRRRRRRHVVDLAGLSLGALLGAGLFGLQPAAYGVATALGGAWLGSPLVFSALLPLLATLLFLGVRPLRGLLAGLSLGYAAVLLHGAVVLPTPLTGLPGGAGVDRLWLVANAGVALWLVRRISRRLD